MGSAPSLVHIRQHCFVVPHAWQWLGAPVHSCCGCLLLRASVGPVSADGLVPAARRVCSRLTHTNGGPRAAAVSWRRSTRPLPAARAAAQQVRGLTCLVTHHPQAAPAAGACCCLPAVATALCRLATCADYVATGMTAQPSCFHTRQRVCWPIAVAARAQLPQQAAAAPRQLPCLGGHLGGALGAAPLQAGRRWREVNDGRRPAGVAFLN